MIKIKSKFIPDNLITVHDNLLCDLYSLNRDNGFKFEKINNHQYLINQKQGRGYIIGIRTKIPEDLLCFNNKLCQFDELDKDEKRKIEEKLSTKLYFSNMEIYVSNMLFDKFLREGNNFKISIGELEGYYRKCKRDYSKIRIDMNIYNSYINTLNSLAEKEIFLETNDTFRNDKYGARNINFSHRFLSLYQIKSKGIYDLEFRYTFQNFGNVIRQCKRYSNILPKQAFKIRLNQTTKYVAAFFVVKDVFIVKGKLKRSSSYFDNKLEITYDDYISVIKYDGRTKSNKGYSLDYKLNRHNGIPNKLRIKKMLSDYVLSGFRLCNVYCIKEEYSYDETDKFLERHEFDYDNDFNLNYEFSKDDVGKDVEVKFIIYIDDPSYFECYM